MQAFKKSKTTQKHNHTQPSKSGTKKVVLLYLHSINQYAKSKDDYWKKHWSKTVPSSYSDKLFYQQGRQPNINQLLL